MPTPFPSIVRVTTILATVAALSVSTRSQEAAVEANSGELDTTAVDDGRVPLSTLLNAARSGPLEERWRAWSVALQVVAEPSLTGGGVDGDVIYEALASGQASVRSLERAVRSFLDDPRDSPGARRLVAQLELLNRDALRNGPTAARIDGVRSSGAIDDPVPESPLNERLYEHLSRVVVALQRYGWAASPTGLDDRGDTWVRYGSPSRTRTVSFDEGQILQAARTGGLSVSRADFPDNEVWMYDGLSDQGVFLFVKQRRGGYKIGGSNDLIPRALLTRGVVRSPRAEGFSIVGLQAMRYVLGQLALFHPAYSSRYSKIQNYVSYVEEAQISNRINPRGGPPPRISGFERSAWRGFEQAIERNTVGDEDIARARQETMPDDASRVELDDVEVRLVRFLDPDGSTVRTVLWQVDGDSERRSSVWEVGARHQRLTSAEGTGTFRAEVRPSTGGQVAVQVDRAIVAGDTALWRPTASGYVPVRANLDATTPLELSDPLPFESDDVVWEGNELRSNVTRDRVRPLYRETLQGLEGLGVYLEAYVSSATGVVRVTYRIERQRDGRLFRREQVEDQKYEFIRTVHSRTIPIAFLVDRANWEGADTLRLVIQVEDIGTGTTAQRDVKVRVE